MRARRWMSGTPRPSAAAAVDLPQQRRAVHVRRPIGGVTTRDRPLWRAFDGPAQGRARPPAPI